MHDVEVTVEIPEGAVLKASPAGMVSRGAAYFIDSLIRWTATFVLVIVVGAMGQAGTGIFLIFYFLIEWFYPVFFEVWRNGQTPGKKMMNLQVLSDNLTPVSFAKSLTRNLLRVVDFLPSFFFGAIVAMGLDKYYRRLGDIAAGTLVVYVPQDNKVQYEFSGSPISAPFHLSLSEKKSVVSLVERKEALSQARQMELASILMPHLRVRTDDDAVANAAEDNAKALKKLHGIAAGIVGKSSR